MYLSPWICRVVVALWEAVLPDEAGRSFVAVRERVVARMLAYFDPQQFDDPVLRSAVPWIFRLIGLAPILFFWLIWKPLPLTRLSLADRQLLFRRMEHSRIYSVRGLFVVAKVYSGFFVFDDLETHDLIGYDRRGALEPTINPNDALERVTIA